MEKLTIALFTTGMILWMFALLIIKNFDLDIEEDVRFIGECCILLSFIFLMLVAVRKLFP